MKIKRIGIYSGTFNPVHAGHVAFALQAMQTAKLDAVYFLPERRPRHKQGVEHFAHRVAMLKAAAKPHKGFQVLELDDISFTVKRTLPKLESLFPGAKLYFLVGSDTALHVADWPLIDRLLLSSELIIGLRAGDDRASVEKALQAVLPHAKAGKVIDSYAPHVSSHSIREALRTRKHTPGLLRSVARYSDRHWLYISLG